MRPDTTVMAQQAADSAFLESKARDDQAKANSMQGTYRSNGALEMRGKYHADTMIDVGGAKTRVDSAIAAGLIDAGVLGQPIVDTASTHQTKREQQEEVTVNQKTDASFDISNLNLSIEPEMHPQITYVEGVLGVEGADSMIADFYTSGLDVDSPVIKQLAESSGLSPEQAAKSAQSMAEAKVAPLAQAFETLVGTQVNLPHALEWLQSSAVTQKERSTIKLALRTGNGAALSGLANKYKTSYNL